MLRQSPPSLTSVRAAKPKDWPWRELHAPWEASHREENTVTLSQFTWILSQSKLGPGVPLLDSEVIRGPPQDSL